MNAGLCIAGYYCQGRAETKIHVATLDYKIKPCLFSIQCFKSNCLFSLQLSGLCNAGYYCQGRAETKIPVATIDYPENGPCPAGFYCDEGIPAPTQCPVGTVRRVEGKSSSNIFPSRILSLLMETSHQLFIEKTMKNIFSFRHGLKQTLQKTNAVK